VTEVIGLPDSTSSETDDLVTQFSYTASGQVATIIDPLGRLTQFTYDTFGRNTQITLAAGTADEGTLSFTYDAAGNVLTATDPNLNVSSFTWDALNRRTSFTDAILASATYVYDARGNLVQSTDRAGSAIDYQYDPLSRLIRATDAQDNVTVIGYDLFGNRTSVIDPLNQQSTYTYDGRNRMRTHTDPDGGVTQFIYDADNNLTRLIDPVGNLTQFVYDARGRQTREVDPLGAVLKYEYDLVDNLVRKTDRNDRVTEFTYDNVDRLVTERWLNANSSIANTVNYSYDKASNLTALADLFSSLSWAYDSRDRAITESNAGTPGAPVVQLAYAYDAASNVLSVNDTINGTAGAATSYLYDALNRMRRITQTDNGGLSVADKRVDIAYNGIGQFTSINRYADLAGSQLVMGTTYQFDSLNRLTRLAHDNSTSTVAFYDYIYDADSRISSITNVDGITNYTYDDRDQLIGADHADASNPDETYQYDANGNRLQSHLHNGGYVTGTANRLLSDGTFNYLYDAEGNRIRQTNVATGEYREFEYDHRNRLVAVVDFSAANVEQQRVEFVYDAIGRRISKAVDGVITQFVYDGHGVILDFVDQDGVGGNAPVFSQRYLHGPAIDQVFAQESDVGDVSWLLADHLGTTRDIVDSTGQLENHIKYDSFGNVISQSGPSTSTRYLFTGRELDSELGLIYFRSRFFDPFTGRFVSEDGIRFFAGDSNLYRYVGNEAIDLRDPSGHSEEEAEGFARKLFGRMFGGNKGEKKSISEVDQTVRKLNAASRQGDQDAVKKYGQKLVELMQGKKKLKKDAVDCVVAALLALGTTEGAEAATKLANLPTDHIEFAEALVDAAGAFDSGVENLRNSLGKRSQNIEQISGIRIRR
jgi:RHS repeat-associated protein